MQLADQTICGNVQVFHSTGSLKSSATVGSTNEHGQLRCCRLSRWSHSGGAGRASMLATAACFPAHQTGGQSEVGPASDQFETGTYGAEACWGLVHLQPDGVLIFEQRLTLLAQRRLKRAAGNRRVRALWRTAKPSTRIQIPGFLLV